jgi:hypothetical protein
MLSPIEVFFFPVSALGIHARFCLPHRLIFNDLKLMATLGAKHHP